MNEKKISEAGLPGLSEEGIISLARGLFHETGPAVAKGVGDDAAVIRGAGGQWLWACDQMVEDIHFRRTWQTAAEVAAKLLAVNLSDMAAMGGRGVYGLLALAFPQDLEAAWVEEFYDRLRTEAEHHGVAVLGGDTTGSPGPIVVSLSLWGRVAGDRILYRSGGRAGDTLLVSRPLGGSAAALELLKAGQKPSPELRQALVAPKPEVELGPMIAETELASAMIDLSDGLATDAWRLAEASDLAAVIDFEKIPLHPSLTGQNPAEARELALHGGEEYALLLSAEPAKADRLIELVQKETGRELTKVGHLEEGQGLLVRIDDRLERCSPRGFDHFGSRDEP